MTFKIKFYDEASLKDAIVIDSEGYVYGKVGEFVFTEGDIQITVYEEQLVEESVPDVDKLRKVLLKNLSEKKRFTFKKLREEDLLEEVRSSLGLPSKAKVTEKHLVEYAQKRGIKIPQKTVTRIVKYEKGRIRVSEIQAINLTKIPSPDGAKEENVKVVLLKTPRQALYADIKSGEGVPVFPREQIRGKLVINQEAKVLGYAHDIVIAPGAIGLRVIVPPKVRKIINMRMLAEYLIETYTQYCEYGQRIREKFRDKPIVPYSEIKIVKKWMKEEKFPEDVIKAVDYYVEEIREEGKTIDIPWNSILKIGDVILVKGVVA